MLKYNKNIAVLIIIYNRPDTTKRVFDIIKKVKPKRLYIAADGRKIIQENLFVKKQEKFLIMLIGIVKFQEMFKTII